VWQVKLFYPAAVVESWLTGFDVSLGEIIEGSGSTTPEDVDPFS
jgi:hypothetical protein